MKNFVVFLLLYITCVKSPVYCQEWRDSLNKARNLYKTGQYNEALKYYKSAQRLAPNDVNLSEEKGQSAYRATKYQEAEQAFQHSANSETDFKKKASAYNNLGSSRLKQKNFKGAEEAFKEALRTDPKNEKARQQLAEVKRLKQKQKQENERKDNKDKEKQSENTNEISALDKKSQPKEGDDSGMKQKNNTKESNDGKQQQNEQKLADKQSDRKLDELMRQEMDTKKRLDDSKGKRSGKKANKDW